MFWIQKSNQIVYYRQVKETPVANKKNIKPKPLLSVEKFNKVAKSLGGMVYQKKKKIKGELKISTWYVYDEKSPKTEYFFAKILTGLSHQIRHAGRTTKSKENKKKYNNQLKDYAKVLNHFRKYLDPHGKAFADGKLTVYK